MTYVQYFNYEFVMTCYPEFSLMYYFELIVAGYAMLNSILN